MLQLYSACSQFPTVKIKKVWRFGLKDYIITRVSTLKGELINMVEPQKNVYLETEFAKMLKMYKSYGSYDCLVMCSGGKGY